MVYIKAKDGVQLHVKDVGAGKPVVLIHGWPLTGDMFEYQADFIDTITVTYKFFRV